MVLDPHRAQGKAQQPIGQLPGAAGTAVDMAHQHFVVMLARHPLQATGDLPRPGLEQFVARGQ
ncbi:hypothetical protein D3C79_1080030 [compost metagenome]